MSHSTFLHKFYQIALSLGVIILMSTFIMNLVDAYSAEIVEQKLNGSKECVLGICQSWDTYDCDQNDPKNYVRYHHQQPGNDPDPAITSCPKKNGLQSYCEGTGNGIACKLKCEDISDPGTCGQTSGCFYYRGGRTDDPRCVEGSSGFSCAGALCYSFQVCHPYATKSGSGAYAGAEGFCGGELELGPRERCETSNECVGSLLCQGGVSSISGGGGICTPPIIDNNAVLPDCPTSGFGPKYYCQSTPDRPSDSLDSNYVCKDSSGAISAALKCYKKAPVFDDPATGGTDTCTDPRTAGGYRWECKPSASCSNPGTGDPDFLICPNSGEVCCNMGRISGTSSQTPPAATPTPTPPTDGPGYCGDSVPTSSTMRPVGGPTCAANANSVIWKQRSTDTSGYDPYCDSTTGGQQRYFYACLPQTPATPPPTPTPFTAAGQGASCNPSQGPWQCVSQNVCLYVSGSEGRCCPANTMWQDNACVPTPTPAPYTPPAGGGAPAPTATPTPVATGSTCNDYIPTSNIHQVCRQNSCQAGENENPGGNGACSSFYGTSYGKCCQLPQGSGPAGSSCNLPDRTCNPSQNASNGTNPACSGCGGYCVGSGTSGTCQNPYAP